MDFEGWGGINKGRICRGGRGTEKQNICFRSFLLAHGSSRTNLDQPVHKVVGQEMEKVRKDEVKKS
jgi:hypothetical protein